MAMLQGSRLVVWGALGALNGAIAVAAGAFAAHALDGRAADLVETGARWQAVAALAAVLSAALGTPIASILHNAGALIFAASLYLLAAGAPSVIGMATPIGGVAMIAGWLALALALFRSGR